VEIASADCRLDGANDSPGENWTQEVADKPAGFWPPSTSLVKNFLLLFF
jgi:hypothetical protein